MLRGSTKLELRGTPPLGGGRTARHELAAAYSSLTRLQGVFRHGAELTPPRCSATPTRCAKRLGSASQDRGASPSPLKGEGSPWRRMRHVARKSTSEGATPPPGGGRTARHELAGANSSLARQVGVIAKHSASKSTLPPRAPNDLALRAEVVALCPPRRPGRSPHQRMSDSGRSFAECAAPTRFQ